MLVIYFQYYHLSFKPFIMQRTERIEMVLLRKSNELKKKKRYKLLKRLRLCLNILIKNEKKNPSSGCFWNPSHLTTYPVNPSYLTIVSWIPTIIQPQGFRPLWLLNIFPEALHFCSTECILSLQGQTHNLCFLLNFLKNTA